MCYVSRVNRFLIYLGIIYLLAVSSADNTNPALSETSRSGTRSAAKRIHWVDNFAKCYSSRSMFSDKSLYKECLWTAHALKRCSMYVDTRWKRVEETIAASLVYLKSSACSISRS